MIQFGMKDYRNYGVGCFKAIYIERMNNAAAQRAEYGRRPNRCHFDPDEAHKLRNSADPEFDIYGSWMDLMMIYHWIVATTFMLRAQKEVSHVVVHILAHFDITL
jgi:hypothetical protein